MPPLRQANLGDIQLHTVEKSQTNAISVTMHLLRQAIWRDIWKPTAEKSQTNATNATKAVEDYCSSKTSTNKWSCSTFGAGPQQITILGLHVTTSDPVIKQFKATNFWKLKRCDSLSKISTNKWSCSTQLNPPRPIIWCKSLMQNVATNVQLNTFCSKLQAIC